MDRMQVCGTCDLGSIPGESTITKTSTLIGVPFLFVLSQQSLRGFAPGIEARLSYFVSEAK